jgi:hypothetical protein
MPIKDLFHSDEPVGIYQVWHKLDEGYAHVADVDCGNLLAAYLSTQDGYPHLKHMVTPVEGQMRATTVGDRIIDPNGKAYEITKKMGLVTSGPSIRGESRLLSINSSRNPPSGRNTPNPGKKGGIADATPLEKYLIYLTNLLSVLF